MSELRTCDHVFIGKDDGAACPKCGKTDGERAGILVAALQDAYGMECHAPDKPLRDVIELLREIRFFELETGHRSVPPF